MDPTREPAPDLRTDAALVAYLREQAPGLPAIRFDAGAVTAHAHGVLRRQRRRRLRNGSVITASAAAVYLALALIGPVPVPGVGPVSVPGSHAIRAAIDDMIPARPPGPDDWSGDVDRLESEVLPVVQRLGVDYYLLEAGPPCRILEYPRGNFRDGASDCRDLVPFDAQARADFDEVTAAVERCGVAVERIVRHRGVISIPLEDSSWQYTWEYVYLDDVGTPPEMTWPEEQWTHIRGQWWVHRARDD